MHQVNDTISKSCYDSQNKLWAHFQNKSPETFEDAKPRLDYILRAISRKKISDVLSVLNIGAGNGYFEERAKQSGWEIYSLDPDEITVKRLLEKGIKASKGHIEQMPFCDRSFDFVVASEVLEHLSDNQFRSGIGEIVRVMRNVGWFLGTVPYCENLSLNQVICPRCGEIFHRWGHKRSFDIRAIRDELSQFFSGAVVKRRTFVRFQGRGIAGTVKSAVRLILGTCGAEIASPNIFFVAKK
jgi:SAM-dependent methyltransferase